MQILSYCLNRYSFTYLVAVYLLFGIFTIYGEIAITHQLKASLVFLSLFGIPHGAIDNVLFLSKHKLPQLTFYSLYLLTISLYCCFWYYFPVFSLLFFLLISAFHFGESQLSDYKLKTRFKKSLYTFWGVSMLSTLVYYNQNELLLLCQEFNDTVKFIPVFNHHFIEYVFYGSNLILVSYLCVQAYRSKHEIQDLLTELFQLFLIHLTFYLFPIIISFTLYFIFLHSIKVLAQEYNYLKEIRSELNLKKFIILLLPHTFISLLFLLVIYLCIQMQVVPISLFLFSIISISVITLPHAIIMTYFYD